MADSYFDNAGGLQSVPDVNVTEMATQPYIATDGSMQSALAVNVLSGGLPPGDAAVSNGDPVLVNDSGGTTSANGTAVVTSGNLTGVNLDSTVAIIGSVAKTNIAVTGTFVTTVEFTVTNGVITAINLS